jgi:hypothetical protein
MFKRPHQQDDNPRPAQRMRLTPTLKPRLPTDVLDIMLGYLPHKEEVKVCSMFDIDAKVRKFKVKNLVDLPAHPLHITEIILVNPHCIQGYKEFIETHFPNRQSIYFSDEEENYPVPPYLISQMPTAPTMHFEYTSFDDDAENKWEGVKTVVCRYPLMSDVILKHLPLDIEEFRGLKTSHYKWREIPHFGSLQTVEIDMDMYQANWKPFRMISKDIKSVCLTNFTAGMINWCQSASGIIKRLVRKIPNLKHLKLKNWIDCEIKTLGQIESLELESGCGRASDLFKVIAESKYLKHFTITKTDINFDKFDANDLIGLETLTIEKREFIDSDSDDDDDDDIFNAGILFLRDAGVRVTVV